MRAFSLGVLACALTALAVYVWRARPDNSINRWFGIFTVSLGGWVLGIAGVEAGNHTEIWGRIAFVCASFIPSTLLSFSRVFPATSRWPSEPVVKIALATGIVWAALSGFTPLVAYDIKKTAEGIQRSPGVLYPLFAAYFLICVVPALAVFVVKWYQLRGLARAQLQHLAMGLLIGGFGAITTNLLIPVVTGRSPYSWLGPYFTFPLVLLVGHAIIRHRLMDLRVVINRSLARALLMALISGIVIVVGRYTFLNAGQILAIPADALIIALVTLALLSVPAQKVFERLIDPYLYRGRIEHSSALRGATHRLSHLMQPGELATEVRKILTEAFVPESFSMLARPLEGGPFEEISSDTPADTDLLTVATLLVDRPTPSVVIVNPSREQGSERAAHDALRDAGIEIVIALGRRGQRLGAILLGPRKSGDAYFIRDLNFIESLAELASIALENSLLYRQRIQMLEYSDRLLESLDAAVVAVTDRGKITSFNSAARNLLGLREVHRTSGLEDLPSEIAWALAFAINGSWRTTETEVSIDHETRGLVPVILSTAVLNSDYGDVAGALVVVTDLSRVKALERNQRRVEHLATMARFYAGIAHEIRSPLTAISNFISMLPDRFDDPEYRDTAARLLPLEVGRIVRLADRLRLMAPSEDGKLTTIALPPLLSDIVTIHSPAAEEHRVKITLTCSNGLPNILGDPSQLVQLFVNLLRNAIESMPEGGGVTVTGTHVPARQGAGKIVVRVMDEGNGIDPAVRAQLFQPFVTTKPSGTGLGLSISREIADFHHARLVLLPRADRRGTVAQVEFPAAPTNQNDDDPRGTPMPSRTQLA